MTEVDVLERYAWTVNSCHSARVQIKQLVQAHQAAVTNLSATETRLKAARQQAANELQSHMRSLQRKLKRRYQQALDSLEQEYQLQQLPISTTSQLLSNSISALEDSVTAIHAPLQQHDSRASKAVKQFSKTKQQIHNTILRGQAAVDHSTEATVAVNSDQQGFSSVQQFLKLKLTIQKPNSKIYRRHSGVEDYGNHSSPDQASSKSASDCAAPAALGVTRETPKTATFCNTHSRCTSAYKQHREALLLGSHNCSSSSSSSSLAYSACSDSTSDSSNDDGDWLIGTVGAPPSSSLKQTNILQSLEHVATLRKASVPDAGCLHQQQQQQQSGGRGQHSRHTYSQQQQWQGRQQQQRTVLMSHPQGYEIQEQHQVILGRKPVDVGSHNGWRAASAPASCHHKRCNAKVTAGVAHDDIDASTRTALSLMAKQHGQQQQQQQRLQDNMQPAAGCKEPHATAVPASGGGGRSEHCASHQTPPSQVQYSQSCPGECTTAAVAAVAVAADSVEPVLLNPSRQRLKAHSSGIITGDVTPRYYEESATVHHSTSRSTDPQLQLGCQSAKNMSNSWSRWRQHAAAVLQPAPVDL